jgi:hypothetical protein
MDSVEGWGLSPGPFPAVLNYNPIQIKIALFQLQEPPAGAVASPVTIIHCRPTGRGFDPGDAKTSF